MFIQNLQQKSSQRKLSLFAVWVLFYVKICPGLDQCQGTVHDLSGGNRWHSPQRRPLIPRQPVVDRDLRGLEKATCMSVPLQLVLVSGLIKEHGAGEDTRICGSHYRFPTGPSAQRLQSLPSVQMWSWEHDPWLLMWLLGGGGGGWCCPSQRLQRYCSGSTSAVLLAVWSATSGCRSVSCHWGKIHKKVLTFELKVDLQGVSHCI